MPFTIEGNLEARLMQLSGIARGQVVSEAIAPAAQLVLQTAQVLVPRRPDQRLADSLFAEASVVADDGAEWVVGTSKARGGWVAPFVEMGTASHEERGGSYVHPGATPHPFLRPALDSNEAEVSRIIGENLAAALGRVGT